MMLLTRGLWRACSGGPLLNTLLTSPQDEPDYGETSKDEDR